MSALKRSLVISLTTLSLAFVSTSLTACAGGGASGAEPKLANVKAGTMPEGGEWSGVYFHNFFGRLHLVKDGDTVEGCWRRKEGDKYGRLNGKVDGNLLKYDWEEHRVGAFDPSGTQHGRGYFVYKKAANERDPDYIDGKWGNDKNEVGGGDWKATRLQKKPNCEEVLPDKSEAGVNAGGWE